jgi:uncharacterized protein Usg
MSDLGLQLRSYRLTTAEILYYLPDHPALLQSFTLQQFDLAPEFPVLRRFLDFWGPQHRGQAALGEAGPRAAHHARPDALRKHIAASALKLKAIANQITRFTR